MAARSITLRYPGTCRRCRTAIAPGIVALWSRSDKTVECLECPTTQTPIEASIEAAIEGLPADPFALGPPIERGTPGRNIETEAARRRSRNGGADRPDILNFENGAAGERIVADALRCIPLSTVLNSRRNGRGDIDHIVIAQSGVWVVDAKNYSGDVTMPSLGSHTDLRINGRRANRLLEGVARQVERVRSELESSAAPVHGALCLVGVQWPMRHFIKTPLAAVAPPKRLAEHISQQEPVIRRLEDRRDLAAILTAAFPAA